LLKIVVENRSEQSKGLKSKKLLRGYPSKIWIKSEIYSLLKRLTRKRWHQWLCTYLSFAIHVTIWR